MVIRKVESTSAQFPYIGVDNIWVPRHRTVFLTLKEGHNPEKFVVFENIWHFLIFLYRVSPYQVAIEAHNKCHAFLTVFSLNIHLKKYPLSVFMVSALSGLILEKIYDLFCRDKENYHLYAEVRILKEGVRRVGFHCIADSYKVSPIFWMDREEEYAWPCKTLL